MVFYNLLPFGSIIYSFSFISDFTWELFSCLTKGLSILFLLKETKLLVLLIFSNFLSLFHLFLLLTFISFLLNVVFIFFFLLVSLDVIIIWDFSYVLKGSVLLWSSFITLLLHSIDFGMLYICVHVCLCIKFLWPIVVRYHVV